jgi:cytochrome c oxidase subunit 2
MWSFPLFPQQASTAARSTDALFFFLLGVMLFFAVLIFVLVFIFAIKYRRRDTSYVPPVIVQLVSLEAAWILIPFGLVIVIFAWGTLLYFEHRSPPPGAIEMYVVGKQWMWKTQHPEGQREINTLHVPVGRPVKLIMTSEDVIHSFFVPAFRVKQDVLPGRYTSLWFQATAAGEYHLFCSQYCGTDHAQMIGTVVAMEDADYQRWLGGGAAEGTMASAGERLFNRLGCATCHLESGQGRGPALGGIYGRGIGLANGRVATADEDYLRESILNPGAKIVGGYPNDMPTYQGQVTEEQLMQLMAYIKSLKP